MLAIALALAYFYKQTRTEKEEEDNAYAKYGNESTMKNETVKHSDEGDNPA